MSNSGPSTSSGRSKRSCSGKVQWQKPFLTDEELEAELADDDMEWEDFEESPSEYSVSESDDDESSDDSDIIQRNNLNQEQVINNDNLVDADQMSEPEAVVEDEWHEVDCSSLHFDISFTGSEEYIYHQGIYPNDAKDLQPIDIYQRFLDDEILDLIVLETNNNAHQALQKANIRRSARIKKWFPTTKEEMKKFLGLVMYMGLVKYPKISDYWRKHPLYNNKFVPSVMSRNRFQLLLKLIHFADNVTADKTDRLYKVNNIKKMFQDKCSNECVPGETIAVDETMVPFRGRLLFRQYIPSKRHRYGIKLFKLCDPKGYTYRMSVYTGQNLQNASNDKGLAEKIVLDLGESYLNKGRTMVTDNFYTSIPLAQSLLDSKTHLLGTLRKNRKGLPKDVVNANLKRGEIVGKEKTGVVVAKWKDKRDVFFLSTRHDLEMRSTGKLTKTREEVKKPAAILDYNAGKDGIDVSDQMASYFSPLRKTVRWYHKICFEMLLNTAVVNSLLIYRHFTQKQLQVSDFREELVLSLTGTSREQKKEQKHSLTITEERTSDGRKKRKRCTSCYEKMAKEGGRVLAIQRPKLVSTFCNQCMKYMCLPCFTENH